MRKLSARFEQATSSSDKLEFIQWLYGEDVSFVVMLHGIGRGLASGAELTSEPSHRDDSFDSTPTYPTTLQRCETS